MNTTPLVQGCVDQYARSRSALDLALIAFQYSDSFMVAGPTGARVVSLDSTFILFVDDGARRIVFQQEREDFQALRARGVMPA